jgi:two-component system, NtrC family, sensor histidine kinase PilS
MTTGVAAGGSAQALSEDDLREMVLRLAHEIRNPLATIKSAVQLVQRLANLEDAVGEHLDSVLSQVDRIDVTVHEMQRFARIGAGAPVAVDVQGGVDDALAKTPPGHARLAVAGGPTLRVHIEPENLRLALRELVDNARRYSPPGATVMLSWARAGEGLVAIHVDDEGPGVPAEYTERILRPFFSTSTQGTGLGLNIVEKVCRLAGGRLEWRNLAGRGCRFSLVLPGN